MRSGYKSRFEVKNAGPPKTLFYILEKDIQSRKCMTTKSSRKWPEVGYKNPMQVPSSIRLLSMAVGEAKTMQKCWAASSVKSLSWHYYNLFNYVHCISMKILLHLFTLLVDFEVNLYYDKPGYSQLSMDEWCSMDVIFFYCKHRWRS